LPESLASFLQGAIRAGNFQPGQQLPGEHEFSELLGVSRATWRATVQMLAERGVLERRRGVGTFVADSALLVMQEGLEALTSTTDVIRHYGYEPGTSDHQYEVITASPNIASALDLPPGAPLLHISRTRTANQRPVIQCEEYLSTSLISPDQLPDDNNNWSLYALLEAAGSRVVSALCKIKALGADQRLAHRLKVPLQYPLLVLQQTHFNADHQPVLYCENFHDTSVIEFQVLRRG
jgi:GntR family transcriptional regulator